MKRAVIYARFSSDKQTEMSIQAQERACYEYAGRHGLEVVQVYRDEALSGKGSKTHLRRSYNKMIRDAEAGRFDLILCHKYDRIARSLGEHINLAAKLDAAGVELIAVAQDTGNGKESKIIKAVLWSMSEYYIDNLADETRKGLREVAEAGKFTGGVAPFGYRVEEGRLTVEPFEAEWVRKMFLTVSNGDSMTDLINQMGAAGVCGHRGRPITRTAVYEILRNEKYTGSMAYSPVQEKSRSKRREKPNAVRVDNAHQAIVSVELFNEVQSIMNGRRTSGRKTNRLCARLVYCSCGAKMHIQVNKRADGEQAYYYCSKRCGRGSVREEYINGAATAYLGQLMSDENQRTIYSAIIKYTNGADDRINEFDAARKSRIKEKQKQKEALIANLATGALPASVVAEVGKKIEDLDAEIKYLEMVQPPKDVTVDLISGWLESIKKAPTPEAVRLLVERIDVLTDDDGKNSNAVKISSTLTALCGNNGCGGALTAFPHILFEYLKSFNMC